MGRQLYLLCWRKVVLFLVMTLLLLYCGTITAVAMPTDDDLKMARRQVRKIVAGFSDKDEKGQADAALGAGKSAKDEAIKLLLLRGAFYKYIKLNDFESAVCALKTLENGIEMKLPHLLEIIDNGRKKVSNECTSKLLGLRKSLIEAEKRGLETSYLKARAWYREQLSYNGLDETDFTRYGDGTIGDFSYCVQFWDGDDSVAISLENGQYLNYPRSMVKGFAANLIRARILMYRYEHTDNPAQTYCTESPRSARVEMRSSATEGGARSRMGEPRQKRKSGGRKINPNLKRFKGPND